MKKNCFCFSAVVTVLFFVMLSAGSVRAAPIDTKMFSASGIQVDVTAKTAAAAREQAMQDGQKRALMVVMERITPSYVVEQLPELVPDDILNFVQDISVLNEKTSSVRYMATLEVRFKGKSIADVLDMTINRAVEFFENVPQILNKIKVIQEVGLGYIKLGQSSTTLSGGESQRVKLATELSKRDTGKTLYILDEPTTGLHFEDIRVLMNVLNKLVDKGNTVIVIEHNLDVIKMADYIIDMGPEGGKGGGELLSCGTPEEVAKSEKGYTPKFLREELGDNY